MAGMREVVDSKWRHQHSRRRKTNGTRRTGGVAEGRFHMLLDGEQMSACAYHRSKMRKRGSVIWSN